MECQTRLNGDRQTDTIVLLALLSYLDVLLHSLWSFFRHEKKRLHPDSFKTLKLKEQTFYSLQAYHSKMTPAVPEKTEWLTSPIVGKAIELASYLTQNMRIQLMLSDDRVENQRASSIWLVQQNKSKKPNILTGPPFARHHKQLVEEAGAIVDEHDYEEFKLLNPN